MKRPNSAVWYHGPSTIDGSLIVGAVSGLVNPSNNDKTGDLFQTWIMPDDERPNMAVKTGRDRSVCGDCGLRPLNHKATPIEDRPCYVKTFQGPRSVWEYLSPHGGDPWPVAAAASLSEAPNRVAGLRFGAWGEPTAIPLDAWWSGLLKPLSRWIDWTKSPGYTHRWRDCDQRWRGYLMASVHTEIEASEARAMGWRTYRIGDPDNRAPWEIECPHATHGVQCAGCGLCDGVNGLAIFQRADGSVGSDRRKSIVQRIH